MKIVNSRAGGWVNFVQTFDGFLHVVPYRRQSSHDGRGAEAVGDHGEVGEVTLDAGLQDRLGVGVAQRGPVLVQQVHQLLADEIGLKQELLPPVDLGRVGLVSTHVLCHLSGRELRLTNVAEVPGEVYGLPLHQAGQQGHVGRLPPPCWQSHPQLVQLLSQNFPIIFSLGSPEDSAQKRGVEALRGREPSLDLGYGDFVF